MLHEACSTGPGRFSRLNCSSAVHREKTLDLSAALAARRSRADGGLTM